MAKGLARWAVLALAAVLASGPAGGAARRPAGPVNQANDKLLRLKPPARAAELAQAVGHWCIGTNTFAMGVTRNGRGAGNAYWSLRCADGSAWVVQIDPLGEFTAIDCATFKAAGGGKECFKKF